MGFFKKLFGSGEQASPLDGVDLSNATHADADALCNLANKYLRNGQFKEAINIHKKVLSINPQHAISWSNLGVAHQELNQLTEAIDALKHATKINPEYANAWHNLGNAYFAVQQIDKAAEAFQQAISINPEHISAKHNLRLCGY